MASILPYSIDPIHGNYYILLGRESFIPEWEGSGLYSDWGGGINPDTDMDEYDTAGREFFEETNNSIPLYEGETCPRPDWRGISTMLREGKYTMKIKFETDGWSYYTIIKQIPWMPDITDTFSAVYLRAMTNGSTTEHFTEKDDAQWVTPQRLLRIALSGRRRRRRASKSSKMYNETIQLRPHFKKRIVHILRNFPAKFAATMPPPSPVFSSAFSWRNANDAATIETPITTDGKTNQNWTSDACKHEKTGTYSTSAAGSGDSACECRDGYKDANGHSGCTSIGDYPDVPPGFPVRTDASK